MERAELDQIERVINHELRERFLVGAVDRAVLLQHGDDPVIEPGQLLVRVFVPAPDRPEDYDQALAGWRDAHQAGMDELRRELSLRLPSARLLEFTFDVPDADYATDRDAGRRVAGRRAAVRARDRDQGPGAAAGQLRVPRAGRAGRHRDRGAAGGRRVRQPGRDHPHRAAHQPPAGDHRRPAPARGARRRSRSPSRAASRTRGAQGPRGQAAGHAAAGAPGQLRHPPRRAA